jgi:probable HAF family extracellular repeat protein
MRRHLLIATGLVCFALCQVQFAPAAYYVTYLGLPTSQTSSYANAINANGQIVGYGLNSLSNSTAYMWTAGGGTASTNLGAGEARGINSFGQVVGFYSGVGGYQGFSWTSGGGTISLQGLKVNGGGKNPVGQAFGVSDAGLIVGTAGGSASTWTPTGVNVYGNPPAVLSGISGNASNGAYAINASGQIAGDSKIPGTGHAALWPAGGGAPADLGSLIDPSTAGGSFAWSLNDAGQVVGYSTAASMTNHAFLWTSGVGLTDLGTLGTADKWSYARGINAVGQVVGYSTTSDTVVPVHAFVWTSGAGMIDLNSRVDTGGAWTIEEAHGINASGQIVGFAAKLVGSTINHREAVLLTPALGGDANLDKTVNGADLNVVLSNYNQTVSLDIAGWKLGDFNGDGSVDGADLNVVLSNYNQSASAGAAVPEPSALLLVVAALAGWAALRRASATQSSPNRSGERSGCL